MSLGSALSIAQTGLSATSRAADLTSQNVANALNEGYARRELALGTRLTGGVMVEGITRFADRAIIADRRIAQAEDGGAASIADFLRRMEDAVGADGSTGSVGGLVLALDAALIAASGQPQSESVLGAAVTAADALASRLNGLTDTVQAARLAADKGIAKGVAAINTSLLQLEKLNGRIVSATGAEAASLQDQRQQLVDIVAAQIPLREIERDDGRIALMTPDGTMLLDGKAAQLGFAPANIMADGVEGAGLTINGRPLDLTSLGNGELAAQFTIRDTLGLDMQKRLDAFADDLGDRLEGTGLLQVSGGQYGVDPRLVEEPFRLREGLSAEAETAPGDASRLNAILKSLAAGAGASGSVASLVSGISTSRVAAEDRATFASARHDALRMAELSDGVDTDAEMTKLLSIQQAYTANARVIQAVDKMMQDILGL
ncbi:flagellar hook-associated protein FlgK [Falsirhodobacter deserti]|uniref:flagellar hook-associated protein FlgK n=1 Tax=Falsirhodobacter deserti TaxID=1365611 RepID=UPI000FE3B13B|nr:flagellar hook-associated protein FlgK [Falsirhodobacter deserti]